MPAYAKFFAYALAAAALFAPPTASALDAPAACRTPAGNTPSAADWRKRNPQPYRISADALVLAWEPFPGAAKYAVSLDCGVSPGNEGQAGGFRETAGTGMVVVFPATADPCVAVVVPQAGDGTELDYGGAFANAASAKRPVGEFPARNADALDGIIQGSARAGWEDEDADGLAQDEETATEFLHEIDAAAWSVGRDTLRKRYGEGLDGGYRRALRRIPPAADPSQPLDFPEASDEEMATSLGIAAEDITTAAHFRPSPQIGDLVFLSYRDPATGKEMAAVWENRLGLREVLGERKAVKRVDFRFDAERSIPRFSATVEPEGGKRYILSDWIWQAATGD